ncbi:hypothetical protein AAIR98_000446 [Elusimicrobium simillimum]|uniref:trypsin-like serine protease n=1 Tax=Elusimicrobium simillimum TaxID=3143438 RepID=UPI003C6FEAE1
MNLKKLLVLLLVLFSVPVYAEVSFISVTGTDAYTQEDDFSNTYDIRVRVSPNQEKKCQAVRVHQNYFLTAAHCVAGACDNGCSIKVVLHTTPSYEIFTYINNTADNQTVFYESGFVDTPYAGQRASDVAVLKFNPMGTVFFFNTKVKRYYDGRNFLLNAPNAENIVSRVKRRMGSVKELPMISFKNNFYRLNRVLTLITLDGADREVKVSGDYARDAAGTKNPSYFLKDDRILMTRNFGSKKGVSGSGVMTNTGELAGIVSFDSSYIKISTGKVAHTYSGFATFNDRSLRILRAAMGAAYEDLIIYDAVEKGFAQSIKKSVLPEPLKMYLDAGAKGELSVT